MRWSFWLFVLAEFCMRCETKATWRGVCSKVPSGVQRQSSWGGQGKPHEAVGFLALGWNWFHWLSENITRCATRTSAFASTTLRGGVPQYFLIGSVQMSWVAPEDSGRVQTPKPPVASPLRIVQVKWKLVWKIDFLSITCFISEHNYNLKTNRNSYAQMVPFLMTASDP